MNIEWPNNALQRFGVVGGSRRRIGASQGLAVNRACGRKRVNCRRQRATVAIGAPHVCCQTPIMKPHLILAFAIANLSLTQAFSQGPAQPPMISVSGSAEVKVAPDEIYLRVGVETRHDNLEDAKKQNDERVSKALAFLKSSDVTGKDVQTDFISIEPTYDSNVSRTKPVTYIVRKSIEVKLTKIESFEGLLTGLLTNGVNNVHGIEFRTSQLRKHRD